MEGAILSAATAAAVATSSSLAARTSSNADGEEGNEEMLPLDSPPPQQQQQQQQFEQSPMNGERDCEYSEMPRLDKTSSTISLASASTNQGPGGSDSPRKLGYKSSASAFAREQYESTLHRRDFSSGSTTPPQQVGGVVSASEGGVGSFPPSPTAAKLQAGSAAPKLQNSKGSSSSSQQHQQIQAVQKKYQLEESPFDSERESVVSGGLFVSDERAKEMEEEYAALAAKRLLRKEQDLFDVALVKRRTTPKKAGLEESGARNRGRKAFARVVLFPLYMSWWKRRGYLTSFQAYLCLFVYVVYALFAFRFYLSDGFSKGTAAGHVAESGEVISPFLILILLGVLYGRAAADSFPARKEEVGSPPYGAVGSGSSSVGAPSGSTGVGASSSATGAPSSSSLNGTSHSRSASGESAKSNLLPGNEGSTSKLVSPPAVVAHGSGGAAARHNYVRAHSTTSAPEPYGSSSATSSSPLLSSRAGIIAAGGGGIDAGNAIRRPGSALAGLSGVGDSIGIENTKTSSSGSSSPSHSENLGGGGVASLSGAHNSNNNTSFANPNRKTLDNSKSLLKSVVMKPIVPQTSLSSGADSTAISPSAAAAAATNSSPPMVLSGGAVSPSGGGSGKSSFSSTATGHRRDASDRSTSRRARYDSPGRSSVRSKDGEENSGGGRRKRFLSNGQQQHQPMIRGDGSDTDDDDDESSDDYMSDDDESGVISSPTPRHLRVSNGVGGAIAAGRASSNSSPAGGASTASAATLIAAGSNNNRNVSSVGRGGRKTYEPILADDMTMKDIVRVEDTPDLSDVDDNASVSSNGNNSKQQQPSSRQSLTTTERNDAGTISSIIAKGDTSSILLNGNGGGARSFATSGTTKSVTMKLIDGGASLSASSAAQLGGGSHGNSIQHAGTAGSGSSSHSSGGKLQHQDEIDSKKTLSRDNSNSQSMEDLLNSIKSVHWSSEGPQKVKMSLPEIRAAIERKIMTARENDYYHLIAKIGAVGVSLTPILYRGLNRSPGWRCWVGSACRSLPASVVAVVDSLFVSYLDFSDFFVATFESLASSATHLPTNADSTASFYSTLTYDERNHYHKVLVRNMDSQCSLYVAPSNLTSSCVDTSTHCSSSTTSNGGAALLDLHSLLSLWSHQVLGSSVVAFLLVLTTLVATCLLSYFFLHAVANAEDAFRRRLLYAKYFSKLTSSRRARNAGLPHFRLYKVDHIKVWLSLRARRMDVDQNMLGPYKSSDSTANTLVQLAILFFSIASIRFLGPLLDDDNDDDDGVYGYGVFLHMLSRNLSEWLCFVWASILGTYMMRFTSLANKTHTKYENTSVLLTEQLNVYMKMLKKPHKKEELIACNNMLKVAIKLLKELEGSGKKKSQNGALLNPFIFNLLRVVLLSAAGALSGRIFGFKIRFWKI